MRNWLMQAIAISALGLFSACGDDGGGGVDAGTSADGGGGAGVPVITKVSWAAGANCHVGTAGPYTITVMATDSNTAASSLIFSGSVASCTGTINAMVSTINCPNQATYTGNVTVKDPENHMAMLEFRISPCSTGSAP